MNELKLETNKSIEAFELEVNKDKFISETINSLVSEIIKRENKLENSISSLEEEYKEVLEKYKEYEDKLKEVKKRLENEIELLRNELHTFIDKSYKEEAYKNKYKTDHATIYFSNIPRFIINDRKKFLSKLDENELEKIEIKAKFIKEYLADKRVSKYISKIDNYVLNIRKA